MSNRFTGSLGWGIACALVGSTFGSFAHAESAPAAAPTLTAPAAPTDGSTTAPAAPTNGSTAPDTRGPVAQALAPAAPVAAESTAAPAPADTSGSGSDRGIRLSGSGEL